jgi:hypothetical protein
MVFLFLLSMRIAKIDRVNVEIGYTVLPGALLTFFFLSLKSVPDSTF